MLPGTEKRNTAVETEKERERKKNYNKTALSRALMRKEGKQNRFEANVKELKPMTLEPLFVRAGLTVALAEPQA